MDAVSHARVGSVVVSAGAVFGDRGRASASGDGPWVGIEVFPGSSARALDGEAGIRHTGVTTRRVRGRRWLDGVLLSGWTGDDGLVWPAGRLRCLGVSGVCGLVGASGIRDGERLGLVAGVAGGAVIGRRRARASGGTLLLLILARAFLWKPRAVTYLSLPLLLKIHGMPTQRDACECGWESSDWPAENRR